MSQTSDNALSLAAKAFLGLAAIIAIFAMLERHHIETRPRHVPSASSAARSAPPPSASAPPSSSVAPPSAASSRSETLKVTPPVAPDALTLVTLASGTWESSELGVKLRIDAPRRVGRERRAQFHLVVERKRGSFGCDFDEDRTMDQLVGFDQTFVAWCGPPARSRRGAVALLLDGRSLRFAVLKDVGMEQDHPTATRYIDGFLRRPDP